MQPSSAEFSVQPPAALLYLFLDRAPSGSFGAPAVLVRGRCRKALSYTEHYVNICELLANRRSKMFIIDPAALTALAALVAASSALVWAIRRKP